jgi:hypothetical protein
MRGIFKGGLVATALLAGVGAWAQQPDKPGMTASLVEPEKNGARGAATVAVKVSGVTLTDPATVNEVPKPGQAHLHYQIDDGPVVATTAPKLSFHGLNPGEHKVVVMLAANDHSPLGPQETLKVRVTQSGSK